MTNLNFRQLQFFARVAEYESFSKAAESLYVSQSAVSNSIHNLEDSLHVRLINRDQKRHVFLTDEGRYVYQIVQDILSKCLLLEKTIEIKQKDALIVGSSSVAENFILPEVIKEFSQDFPNCQIDIKEGNSEIIEELLESEKIQLAFVGTVGNPQSLHYEHIADDKLVIVTPNSDRFLKMKENNISGLSILMEEPVVTRNDGSGTQKSINSFLISKGIDINSICSRIAVSNASLQKKLVAEGNGISIMSYSSVKSMIDAREIIDFELDSQIIKREIYFAYKKNREFTSNMKAFRKAVLKIASDFNCYYSYNSREEYK